MFNPEKLLGQLLSSGMGGGRKSGMGTKMGLGMGAIGIAMAAYEHFNKQQNSSNKTLPPTPSASNSVPPPALPNSGPPPISPPLAQPEQPPKQNMPVNPPNEAPLYMDAAASATLLIQTMIAAAWSDGELDEQERSNIIGSATKAQMDQESIAFLESEIQQPKDIQFVASQAIKLNQQSAVYGAAIMAINIDTDQEKDFLHNLSDKLHLTSLEKDQIHNQLGVSL